MTRTIVIGGSVSGLATALFLSRRGHQVTVLEQDGHALSPHPDDDFLPWRRPRVPHAVQPHGLLAPVRNVLLAEAPDVYAAMLKLGARERHEFDWFDHHPPHQPGDEQLVTVQTRRLLLEIALRRALERDHPAALMTGQPVTGLTITPAHGTPRVTGVRTRRTHRTADLVIDCSGRRTRVPHWLADAGCRSPAAESHPTGVSYYCRWYRGRPGHAPTARVKAGSTASFGIGQVFPSDSATFALSFVLSSTDPTRTALLDPSVFEAAARAFPSMNAWLTGHPEPLSPVLAMGGLTNSWTPLADGSGPVATGIINAGDALVHTNPTLGQGAALALRTAQQTARLTGRHPDDPSALAARHHQWTLRELRPWYEHQVTSDRAYAERLRAGAAGDTVLPPPEAAAIEASAWDDPVVMRARARVRHLMIYPDQVLQQPGVRDRIGQWISAHPRFTGGFDGPDRAQWESITSPSRRIPSPAEDDT
ncbi:FAD-dependent oxidoreductase [Streptomyces sp. NPDC091377]|uniref:FAD-dependent oxidoreductase n=1 Tax=Streptomyces sp. NPDC091377 TaxID=3365995 RepID=UPI0037FAC6C3